MAATIPKPPTDHGGGLKRISLLLQPVGDPKIPKDIERFLRWNLTTQRRAELTSPNASALLNDTS